VPRTLPLGRAGGRIVAPAPTLAGPFTRFPGIGGTNPAGSAAVVSPIVSATDGSVASVGSRRARKASDQAPTLFVSAPREVDAAGVGPGVGAVLDEDQPPWTDFRERLNG
jgi:hypothetical protein